MLYMVTENVALDPVERVNDAKFDAEIDKLITFAEDLRLDLMRKHRARSHVAATSFIIFILLGCNMRSVVRCASFYHPFMVGKAFRRI